jgi:peptide chain release factor 1
MSFINKLDNITLRYQELTQKLLDPDSLTSQELAKLAKERADMEEVNNLAVYFLKLKNELEEIEKICADESADPEFKEIAVVEQEDLLAKFEQVQQDLRLALLPKDEADCKNAILEVRAGTGGEEAALFAAVLFHMYQHYANNNGWKFEILTKTETGLDGYKEASALISGKNVFARLKFESGVHRVQRVPETESGGRIHTSAATVAVLPEAEEVDVQIEEKDIRIDVFRASGSGGQHVNTTDSAVRITHIPTGIVVSQQDEKSQHKNKAKALKILRSRIYDKMRSEKDAVRSAMRKGQVGSGDRSERIRTYNYPQSRVTDHRINLTSYQLNQIVNEGKLDEFINALVAEDNAAKLAEADIN